MGLQPQRSAEHPNTPVRLGGAQRASVRPAAANVWAVAPRLVALQEGKGKQRLQCFTDRLSCACFGLANTVTIMFYTVENATKVRGWS